MGKNRWLEVVEDVVRLLEVHCDPRSVPGQANNDPQSGLCFNDEAVQHLLQFLPTASKHFQDLSFAQWLRSTLVRSSAIVPVVRACLQSRSPHHSVPAAESHSAPAEGSDGSPDLLASPRAVSRLLADLLAPPQGPLYKACRQLAEELVFPEDGSLDGSLAWLQHDAGWDRVPSLQELDETAPSHRNDETSCQGLRTSGSLSPNGYQVQQEPMSALPRGMVDEVDGFDMLSLQGSIEDLLKVEGSSSSYQQQQQQHGQLQAEVWGCDDASVSEGSSKAELCAGGMYGGALSGSENESGDDAAWGGGGGGGFNAGTVKRNVARLADPAQRLPALRALCGCSSSTQPGSKEAKGGMATMLGIHPEDIVFSPAWPALCAALPSCLLPQQLPASSVAHTAAAAGRVSGNAASAEHTSLKHSPASAVQTQQGANKPPAAGGVLWPPGEEPAGAASGLDLSDQEEGPHRCGTAAGIWVSGLEGQGQGDTEEDCSRCGVLGEAGVLEHGCYEEVLCAAAELTSQLARQCVATSPVHMVQLLQALQAFLFAGLPAAPGTAAQRGNVDGVFYSHATQASIQMVAASALSLLRGLTQDWHFLPGPIQADAARLVCSLLAANAHTNLIKCVHSLSTASSKVGRPKTQPPPLNQGSPDLCPLHALLRLDPALLWLQRLASMFSSARALCSAATAQLAEANPHDTLSSAAAVPIADPSPSEAGTLPSAPADHKGPSLLQLLVNALAARRQLRQQNQQQQYGTQQQHATQGHYGAQQSQQHQELFQSSPGHTRPAPTCTPAPHELHRSHTADQVVPAAACALLMLPAHAWQGIELTVKTPDIKVQTPEVYAPEARNSSTPGRPTQQPRGPRVQADLMGTTGAHTGHLQQDQHAAQRHVTWLLVEEAMAGALVHHSNGQAPSWIRAGLMPIATLMPHFFSGSSSAGSALYPLIHGCRTILAAAAAAADDDDDNNDRNPANPGASKGTQASQSRKHSTEQPPFPSAHQPPQAHSRAPTASKTADCPPSLLNGSHQQFLYLAGSLCIKLASSQHGADALLSCLCTASDTCKLVLTRTPSATSIRKSSESSTAATLTALNTRCSKSAAIQDGRELFSALYPPATSQHVVHAVVALGLQPSLKAPNQKHQVPPSAQRVSDPGAPPGWSSANEAAREHNTPLLLACALDALQCQSHILRSGFARPLPLSLLPPGVWQLVEAAGVACSHASAPLLALQQPNNGVKELVLALVQQVEELSSSSSSSSSVSHAPVGYESVGAPGRRGITRSSSSGSVDSSSNKGRCPKQLPKLLQSLPHGRRGVQSTLAAPADLCQQHPSLHAARDTACDALLSLCRCCYLAPIAAHLLGTHPSAACVCAQRLLQHMRCAGNSSLSHPLLTPASCCAPPTHPHAMLTLQRPLLAIASHLALSHAMQGALVEAGCLQQVVLQGLSNKLPGIDMPAATPVAQTAAPPPAPAASASCPLPSAFIAARQEARTQAMPVPSKPTQPSSKPFQRNTSLLAHHQQEQTQQQQHPEQQASPQHRQLYTPTQQAPPYPLAPSRPDALANALHTDPNSSPELQALRAAQAVLGWHQLSTWLATFQGRQLSKGVVSWLGAVDPSTDPPPTTPSPSAPVVADAAITTCPAQPPLQGSGSSCLAQPGVHHQSWNSKQDMFVAAAHGSSSSCGQDVAHIALRCLLTWLQDKGALQQLGTATQVQAQLTRLVQASGVEAGGLHGNEVAQQPCEPEEGQALPSDDPYLLLPVDMNVGAALLLLSQLPPPSEPYTAALHSFTPLSAAAYQPSFSMHPLTQGLSNWSTGVEPMNAALQEVHGAAAAALQCAIAHAPVHLLAPQQSWNAPLAGTRTSTLLQQCVAQAWPPSISSQHPPSSLQASGQHNAHQPGNGALTQPPMDAATLKQRTLHRSSSNNSRLRSREASTTPPLLPSQTTPPSPSLPSGSGTWQRLTNLVAELEAQGHKAGPRSKSAPLPSQAAVHVVQATLHALAGQANPACGQHAPNLSPLRLSSPVHCQPDTPTASNQSAPAMYMGCCPDLELPAATLALSQATARGQTLPVLHHQAVLQAATQLAARGQLQYCALVDDRGRVQISSEVQGCQGAGVAVDEPAADSHALKGRTEAVVASQSVEVAALAHLLDAVWRCLDVHGVGSSTHQRMGKASTPAVDATSALVVIVGCLVGLAGDRACTDRSTQAQECTHLGHGKGQQAELVAMKALARIAASAAGPCVWPALTAASMTPPCTAGRSALASRLIADSMRCKLCGALAWVLQQCEPELHAALCGHTGDGLSLASLLHAAARWMHGDGVAAHGGTPGLAFSGWLPPSEVTSLLVLQLVHGPDYLVYSAAAVVKHIEPALSKAAFQSNTEPFLAACQFPDFTVAHYADYMACLAKSCRPKGLRRYLECVGAE